MLASLYKQNKFENDIKAVKNSLTIEIQFNTITDKYVMAKCKYRAYFNYHSSSGNITWKREKLMVFFYGHEIKNENEIQILEGKL